MRGETSLGFNVTIFLSNFIFKVNGTGPLAGHYQLFDSEEPRCKWAKQWFLPLGITEVLPRDGCAYISSSGDPYCFETLGNDEYETRWCLKLWGRFQTSCLFRPCESVTCTADCSPPCSPCGTTCLSPREVILSSLLKPVLIPKDLVFLMFGISTLLIQKACPVTLVHIPILE